MIIRAEGHLKVEELDEANGLIFMAMQASGYDSARGFAIEVLDVDERTVRKWIAGDREMTGATKQLCRAIIAHPEIVPSITIPRSQAKNA